MTDLQTKPPDAAPKTEGSGWAAPVDRLRVGEMPRGSMSATVEGKRLAGPLQGFGQLWQKTFRVHLPQAGLEPAGVVAEWKAHFSEFWPKGNTFYAPLAGIQPGEVALLRITAAGPVKLNTGVMVIYADDTSFTLMTPEGHALAAWITFSAERDPSGTVIAQAQALERTADPLGELAYTFGANKANDRFWEQTLVALAGHFGITAACETTITRVDSRRQWRYARNVIHNAGIRGTLWTITHPRSWLRR